MRRQIVVHFVQALRQRLSSLIDRKAKLWQEQFDHDDDLASVRWSRGGQLWVHRVLFYFA